MEGMDADRAGFVAGDRILTSRPVPYHQENRVPWKRRKLDRGFPRRQQWRPRLEAPFALSWSLGPERAGQRTLNRRKCA
jgi:hypothetical protein